MSDIKKLRQLLKMTQEAFAASLGVSSRTIQNWERGEVVPDTKIAKLKELAAKFPGESFTLFDASDSPGAGYGNDVNGISSADLKRIFDALDTQRKEFMDELKRKDSQIDRLIALLEKK